MDDLKAIILSLFISDVLINFRHAKKKFYRYLIIDKQWYRIVKEKTNYASQLRRVGYLISFIKGIENSRSRITGCAKYFYEFGLVVGNIGFVQFKIFNRNKSKEICERENERDEEINCITTLDIVRGDSGKISSFMDGKEDTVSFKYKRFYRVLSYYLLYKGIGVKTEAEGEGKLISISLSKHFGDNMKKLPELQQFKDLVNETIANSVAINSANNDNPYSLEIKEIERQTNTVLDNMLWSW